MGIKEKPLTDAQLKYATESELALAMMEACAWNKVRIHNNPRSTKKSWDEVERIAEEITRRKNIREEP